MEPYLLCVAGEDSGDLLGAEVVRGALAVGFSVRGAGGASMQAAGLVPLVPFEDLAVCGVGDVILRLPRLRAHLAVLRAALCHPSCAGLVGVDYPGFNLRLKEVAESRGLPVWMVAPPQIWAWKPQRGALFRGRDVAVLFPFEQQAYAAWGARAVLAKHPAVERIALPCSGVEDSHTVDALAQTFLLFPGSRLPQLKRNFEYYTHLAAELELAVPGARAVFVASRPALCNELRARLRGRYGVVLAAEFPRGFAGALGAVCPPGTATLELALAGVPTLVSTVADLCSYGLGKWKVRLPYLALPNLLLGHGLAKEAIFSSFPGLAPTPARTRDLAQELARASAESWHTAARELRGILVARSLESLAQDLFHHWQDRLRAGHHS